MRGRDGLDHEEYGFWNRTVVLSRLWAARRFKDR
jgi:hypothetical protein